MVHGLTAQSGGAMTIDSEIGRGTTVNLWLPRATSADQVNTSVDQSSPAKETASRQLRILLVDDDSLVRMNTAYLLMDLGHSVMEASSGAHALQILDTDAGFDVMITDYAMPGMTGLDLAIRLKIAKPKLPIVLATGYAELPKDMPIELPRLAKPYTQDELERALSASLRMSGQ
jgi:CheY-like chemotaxis protein